MARRRKRGMRGHGSIRQLSSGRWQFRVPVDGKLRTYGIYRTEEEAARAQGRWANTHLLPADDPEVEVPLPVTARPNPPVRLDEVFERWQEAKAARQSIVRQARRRGGAESTAERDRAQWAAWWAARPGDPSRIGDRLVQTVTKDDIARVFVAKAETGRSPNYLRTQWTMVTALFNWMVEKGYLSTSPLAGESIDVDPAGDRVRDIVVPDFRFIGLHSRRLRGRDRLIFELLLGTAGRRSEVAGFRVADADFTARRVWVSEPIVEVAGRLVRRRAPKSGRRRSVTIGDDLARLIREELIRRGRPGPTEPLVTASEGGPIRWSNYLRDVWHPQVAATAMRWAVGERRRLMAEGMPKPEATKAAIAEADRLKKLTPHHLRHTAAALMWAAGASDNEIQLTLGHWDLSVSRKLYAHLLPGTQDSTAAKVERLRREMAV